MNGMFTSTQQKGTRCIKWIFPAFLVLFCTEDICCSLDDVAKNIDGACDNGSTLFVSWKLNSTPYIYETKNQIQGILADVLERGIGFCCKLGVQIDYNILHGDVSNQSINQGFMPLSRLSYSTTTSFGRPFVGLIDSPSIAVVIERSVPGADLLMAILASWPILIFIITTISVSGIIVWALDYKANPMHFPACFPQGVFEGCWWAAVTMTTVGYGDRVPKSFAARLFAVVWINVGLVILAMFMGIVTASLTSSSWMDVNHFWGLEVAVINGSAEYQFAVLQSANVQAQESYEDMYSSVSSGKSKVALVDLYTATWHHDYFSRHKLSIATVIDQPVVYGIVLPQGSQTLQECLRAFSHSYQVEIYSYIAKYITHVQNSNISDGTEYFRESMFGYSVYAMTGIFLVILGIGLWWQYYWQPRRGEWKQGSDIVMKELELATTSSYGYPRVHHTAHVYATTSLESPRAHCARTQQCMGIRQLLDEYREYETSWTKRFTYLNEKHRREQIEVFNLDNDGYDM